MPPVIPAKAGTYPPCRHPPPLTALPRGRESRPYWPARKRRSPSPYKGRGRRERGGRGYCGRDATRPVSPHPRPPVIPAQAGTYPLLPAPRRREPTPCRRVPPMTRHSRVGGNPAPRPQRSNGAHLALKSAHSALTERSNGAHKALIQCSRSAHRPRTAQTASQTPPAPLDPTREAGIRAPAATRFPAFPKPRAPL